MTGDELNMAAMACYVIDNFINRFLACVEFISHNGCCTPKFSCWGARIVVSRCTRCIRHAADRNNAASITPHANLTTSGRGDDIQCTTLSSAQNTPVLFVNMAHGSYNWNRSMVYFKQNSL